MRHGAAVLLGAHVSVAGGLANGPARGVALGCDVIQIFTRNQRQWTAAPVTKEEAATFKAAYGTSGLKGVMAHASYLINLASPKPEVSKQSLAAFQAEAERCHALGVDRFMFHPGAHLEAGVEAGRARIAKALRATLDATEGDHVRILLESMAGQGTTIGDRFEDLAWIIEEAGGDGRLGVCIDTCHAWAAGHDLATAKGYDAAIEALAATVGLDRVHAVHLNDSKHPRGARKDRHANVGEGHLGTDGFRPLMTDRRFAKVPMALETPGGDEGYRQDLARLRRLVP